jgi:hypothetical protein
MSSGQIPKKGSKVQRPAPDARPGPRRHERSDDGNAFIRDPEGGPARISDDLAETMAEGFLQSATSGEYASEELLDGVVTEEFGGPFIVTSAREEFASGTDASNPADAKREALPLTSGGSVENLDE